MFMHDNLMGLHVDQARLTLLQDSNLCIDR